jgi:hypothetical protein
MHIKEFIIKVSFVTFCLGVLLYLFYPCYEFIDETHRVNTITGRVDYYESQYYYK